MLVYICSPYRGDIETNVRMAKLHCKDVIDSGHVPFAPHLFFTQFLNDELPEEREQGIRLGLEMLERCDAMFVYGDPTDGMKAEIEYANRIGVQVIYDVAFHG